MKLIIAFALITSIAAGQQFTRVSTGTPVNDGGDSRSVNWIDYDNDGDLDLYVTNGPSSRANNFLYRNDGSGSFTKITDQSLVNDPGSYDGSSWADIDNDGWLDVYSVTWYGQLNSLHRQWEGSFAKVIGVGPNTIGTYSETASWGDYDQDGFVDLYIANSSGDLSNILFHNNGDGTFAKVLTGSIVTDLMRSRSVDWCDLDNDGDLDLFVANELNQNNSLYWNNGNGTFTAETQGDIVSNGGSSYGSSVGDIDNDGDFDVFVANNNNQNNFLYRNEGNHVFTRITDGAVVNDGGYSVGSVFADIDNDGDIDLVVTNAFSGTSQTKNFMYLNDGTGQFTKVDTGVVSTDLGWSYGLAAGDYDRDGDLDLFIANCYGANQNNALYRNEGNENSWYTLTLKGTHSNASAIGAVVRLQATIGGKKMWLTRMVSGQSGYCGQTLEIHFGLGDATSIDSLEITWPSGKISKRAQVAVQTHEQITEPIDANFLRGAMQIERYDDMAPSTLSFKGLAVHDTNDPITSWEWDFNNDGIADAATQEATYQYALPDTYSVTMIVRTGNASDTVRSIKSVIITESRSIIEFSTATHNFGVIDVNTPQKDTMVYVYNKGKRTDSITIDVKYGSSSAGTIKPDSAMLVYPREFMLAPGDSQGIHIEMYPPRFVRTLMNVTYTPKITISSRYNNGPASFEKTFWIKLQGTLVSVRDGNVAPFEFSVSENYPNPFNPVTSVQIGVPRNEHVVIDLYDVVGRMVKNISSGILGQGWHTLSIDGTSLGSGTYFLMVKNSTSVHVRRLALLK